MRKIRESESVYIALVSELAYTIVPTTVMASSILVVGFFAFIATYDPLLIFATIAGVVSSILKVIIMLLLGRQLSRGGLTAAEARRWERYYTLVTLIVAASVGILGAQMIQVRHDDLEVLATALLFGYAAGVATRVSVRPHIALGAIFTAAVPITISSTLVFDTAHWILTAMFVVFLAAGVQSVLHVYRSTSRQIELRLDMARFAKSDILTGLFNRLGLDEALDKIDRTGEGYLCFHCFDLDGFKAINDGLGHHAGDILLSTLASRLQEVVKRPSLAARVGGDEFVVYQPNLRDTDEAASLAETIFNTCVQPYIIDGHRLEIGLSLGYAFSPVLSADTNMLLRAADAAAYRAKREGGGVRSADGRLRAATYHNVFSPKR